MLDLLLVNPPDDYGALGQFAAVEPPLWCALLATHARGRGGCSVAILDANAEGLGVQETAKRIAEVAPLLCAIIVLGHSPSVSSTPKMTAVIELVKALRLMLFSREIVIGGLHPSALPERTLRETGVHFVCQGEGFETIDKLLRNFKRESYKEPIIPGLWWCMGDATIFGGKARPVDAGTLSMAAWDLLPMRKYRAHNWHCLDRLDRRSPYAVLWTSLGCPYQCSFCNVALMYGGRGIRYRDPVEVANEVDYLASQGVHNIKIMDEMFALKPERVVEVCTAIASLGYDLNIWAYGRADRCEIEMLKAMRAAGIRWLCIGFESAVELVRQGVSKKFLQEDMQSAVERCHEAGINVLGNFIFGLPDDDMETMRETLETAKGLGLDWANFYLAMPYPGSELYEQAVRDKAKLPKRWADWGQYSPNIKPLPTKHVSGEAVRRFRDGAFEEFFNDEAFLKRVEGKFGVKAREHVEEILKIKITRRRLWTT